MQGQAPAGQFYMYLENMCAHKAHIESGLACSYHTTMVFRSHRRRLGTRQMKVETLADKAPNLSLETSIHVLNLGVLSAYPISVLVCDSPSICMKVQQCTRVTSLKLCKPCLSAFPYALALAQRTQKLEAITPG